MLMWERKKGKKMRIKLCMLVFVTMVLNMHLTQFKHKNRIVEDPELEGSHGHHGIQTLAPH